MRREILIAVGAVILSIVLITLLIPGGALGGDPGVSFAFHNPNPEVWNYWLFRAAETRVHGAYVYAPGIDRWVAQVAGGEVQPGATVEGPENYPAGDYIIGWQMRGSQLPAVWQRFRVRPGTTTVILTPDGMKTHLGA